MILCLAHEDNENRRLYFFSEAAGKILPSTFSCFLLGHCKKIKSKRCKLMKSTSSNFSVRLEHGEKQEKNKKI